MEISEYEALISKPVGSLPGVGTVRVKQFAKLGIETVDDLLRHFPRAYQNRGDIRTLAQAAYTGQTCSTLLTVGSAVRTARLAKGKTLVKFIAFDSSGKCTVSFFNQNWTKDVFTIGSEFRFWGKVERFGNTFTMSSPAYEMWRPGVSLPEFTAVYPLTEGLTQKIIANTITTAMKCLPDDGIPDIIPPSLCAKYSLPPLKKALADIHSPDDYDALDGARRHFIFEELYLFALAMTKTKSKEQTGERLPMKACDITKLTSKLAFGLTGAQKRTINEIYGDMVTGSSPMCRLLSGDVGSGKTVCAAAAALIALENGYQCAIMAPTEILAMQHYNDLSPIFTALGYKTDILTGSLAPSAKKKARSALESNETDLIIGTHALITSATSFHNLGLVITDEQHRFGVMQRAALRGKGKSADMLVMTATPIPRSLALILYGDLDISVLDEMPPGRQKVSTYAVDESYRERLFTFIRKQVTAGHQVYIVCPAVENDDRDEKEALVGLDYRPGDAPQPALKSAVGLAAELSQSVFPDLHVEYMHGKLGGAEKDRIMKDFAAGNIDILVSTTVIEVGVNVPNASLMIIENAERFGLSQLHQLRGRVGRGSAKSYCVLVSDAPASGTARERLDAICSSNDGFAIAEQDLKLRGPGDFFPKTAGEARQSGSFSFRMASMCADTEMLKDAVSEAKNAIACDPALESAENAPARVALERMFSLNADTIS